MEVFLKILSYLSGPLIGAVIGYFTNYLAVKMLFRPYTKKKIGKLPLPFTPGIIPKRQPQLAKAIGKTVGDELLTSDDLKQALLSDEAKLRIATAVVDSVYKEKTLDGVFTALFKPTEIQATKKELTATITDKITTVVNEIDVGSIVAEQGGSVIKAKKSALGMLALMLDDGIIDGLFAQIGGQINAYVNENGNALLAPFIEREVNAFSNEELERILPKEKFQTLITALLDSSLSAAIDDALKGLDISALVEAKVNAMDMRDLEKLCLSVMKKELNAVVNLGALLGCLIGVVNIFI